MEHLSELNPLPLNEIDDGLNIPPWLSLHRANPPKTVRVLTGRPDPRKALAMASDGVGLLWRGDLAGARRLLSAMTARLARRPSRSCDDPAADYYQHRQRQRNQARVLGMVLIELSNAASVGGSDHREACRSVYGPINGARLVPLRELLGVLSAHQWRLRGVPVPALRARIHPHYGVFAPTRQDYIDLVAAAPFPDGAVAFDIGTGTGVLAALLANGGAGQVTATDVSPRAVACAGDNLRRLGLADQVRVLKTDFFPPGRADVVVCNPPWLPGSASSWLDAAVFDKDGAMLSGFIDGVSDHLNPGGEAWLVMSDLAELFRLRPASWLRQRFEAAGLIVLSQEVALPRDRRGVDASGALSAARVAERVSLWRLTTKP